MTTGRKAGGVSDAQLRVARGTDLEAVRSLLAELGYVDLDPTAFARAYADVLADPCQQVWLAEVDGAVVGLMSLSTRPQLRLAGAIMTVDEMVVTERTRGQGVGKILIDRAKAEATRAGARRLELTTARGRPSYTRGFYLKSGFVEAPSAVMRLRS